MSPFLSSETCAQAWEELVRGVDLVEKKQAWVDNALQQHAEAAGTAVQSIDWPSMKSGEAWEELQCLRRELGCDAGAKAPNDKPPAPKAQAQAPKPQYSKKQQQALQSHKHLQPLHKQVLKCMKVEKEEQEDYLNRVHACPTHMPHLPASPTCLTHLPPHTCLTTCLTPLPHPPASPLPHHPASPASPTCLTCPICLPHTASSF